MKLSIKKAQANFHLGVILSIRKKPQKIVYFLRNVYLSSIQTMTVGFGFAPNPAVTLAGLKIKSYHRRLGITPDPERLYLPFTSIIALYLYKSSSDINLE